MPVTPGEVDEVYRNAQQLYSASEVEAALDRLATAISNDLAGKSPVILCTMQGGLVTTGKLVDRLSFPLTLDYLHATRYHGSTDGRELEWIRQVPTSIQGKTILIIDDIFDKGITLAEIIKECKTAGAAEIFTAVLVEKDCPKQVDIKPDYIGLVVEDRYVFGYGMDYKGYLRNTQGIYAVSSEG